MIRTQDNADDSTNYFGVAVLIANSQNVIMQSVTFSTHHLCFCMYLHPCSPILTLTENNTFDCYSENSVLQFYGIPS
jgi:hypothetical protein